MGGIIDTPPVFFKASLLTWTEKDSSLILTMSRLCVNVSSERRASLEFFIETCRWKNAGELSDQFNKHSSQMGIFLKLKNQKTGEGEVNLYK